MSDRRTNRFDSELPQLLRCFWLRHCQPVPRSATSWTPSNGIAALLEAPSAAGMPWVTWFTRSKRPRAASCGSWSLRRGRCLAWPGKGRECPIFANSSAKSSPPIRKPRRRRGIDEDRWLWKCRAWCSSPTVTRARFVGRAFIRELLPAGVSDRCDSLAAPPRHCSADTARSERWIALLTIALTACGGGGTTSPTAASPANTAFGTADTNVQPIVVNPGPAGDYANGVFTNGHRLRPGHHELPDHRRRARGHRVVGLRLLSSVVTLPLALGAGSKRIADRDVQPVPGQLSNGGRWSGGRQARRRGRIRDPHPADRRPGPAKGPERLLEFGASLAGHGGASGCERRSRRGLVA